MAEEEILPAPRGDTSLARPQLPYRLRQQAILAEFGRCALLSRDLREVLQMSAKLCAEGLECSYAKVLEYDPEIDRLVIRAGVGWGTDKIDAVSLGADDDSPAGYAFQTGRPVLSNHVDAESSFRTPELLKEYGIRRAINVLIERGGAGLRPFGVLEVDSADPGQFDAADAAFLAGFAGLLGIAIERQQSDERLSLSLQRQELLTREMSHRVKNSLAVVAGLLQLQAKAGGSDDVRQALAAAAARVRTVAEVHDQLWRANLIGSVELPDFLAALCDSVARAGNGQRIALQAQPIALDADRAIPLGLIVNECLFNAIKHAYPGGGGDLEVMAEVRGAALRVEISDRGVGLPAGFALGAARGSLGLRVIESLARQLGGAFSLDGRAGGGTRFALEFPVATPEDQDARS